jgi:hypothetical protein
MAGENIRLFRTCYACPEQYDAYLGDERVGYLRLRHGFFTVDVPWCGGETIYEAEPRGDGIFEPDERDTYLRFAVDAIQRWLSGERKASPEVPNVTYTIEGDA